MRDDLKRVGLVFKADGAVDFRKTLGEINTVVTENNNSFKLAKAAYDENTSAMQKMQDKQKFLLSQTQAYTDKVNVLRDELNIMESAEKRNEQAIRKKSSQLTQAQIQLTKYQKDLSAVTSELNNGTVVTEEKMKRLSETMKDLTAKIREDSSAFSALKSSYDDGTKTLTKYKDTQNFLSTQVENYSKQVNNLKQQIDLLENAEERNERAISEKKTALNNTIKVLNDYERDLDDVETKLKNGTAATEDFKNRLGNFGDGAKNASEKLGGVSAAAAGIIGAVAATVPATEEYRKIMGSLEISSQKAGYSAEQTKESYQTLYGVLGDDQTAATTTANLQALGLSQEQLRNMITGTIGAWSTYGDSIPIDGLAEAINETVKTGLVTGNLADMINWAGTSEDAFNQKLAQCSSESERANLIMQEMANQGLTQAGEKWMQHNANLVAGNQATAEMQSSLASLAEMMSPIITQLTELFAGLLQKFVDAPPAVQGVAGGVVLLLAVLAPLISGVGQLAFGIQALMPIFTNLWLLMAANPVTTLAIVIGTLVAAFVTAYNKCEWFRNGVNKIWEGLIGFFSGCVEKLKSIFNFEWSLPKIKLPHFSITGKFSLNPPSIPKLGVSWYAKGGILNKPTIFGESGGKLLGGGEAGKEAVLPIDLLRGYIREENQANNNLLIATMSERMAAALSSAMQKVNLTAEVHIGDRQVANVMTDAVIKQFGVRSNAYNTYRGR